MKKRPYSTLKLAEIRKLIKREWDSLDSLQEIEKELHHRKAAKAVLLRRKVQKRISELSPVGILCREGSQGKNLEAELYERVGLHPGAPDFLIEAARKAYRKNCRNDLTKDPQETRKALKKVDEIFKQIEMMRE